LLFGIEHRKSERFEYKATVMIENEQAGHLNYGQMVNYSSDGMCIGSDAFYNKGTAINIRFNRPLYKGAPTTYSGTVRWCKELVRDDFEYSYGVGIKYD
jgi:hypothetical protein